MQVAQTALWPLKYVAVYAEVDHASSVPLKVSREYIRDCRDKYHDVGQWEYALLRLV
jgi:hypothetical protein